MILTFVALSHRDIRLQTCHSHILGMMCGSTNVESLKTVALAPILIAAFSILKVLRLVSLVEVNSHLVVTGPSKVALPLAESMVGNEDITEQEYKDYGFRVAKHALRARQQKIYVYTDDWLLWQQVLRCLDWRSKWDLIWTREDNFNKLQKGGSRWHGGEQWERPSALAFERMSRNPPVGIPGVTEFFVRHRKCLEDKHQPDYKFIATVYTVGLACDRLEASFPDLVRRLKEWELVEQNGSIAKQVYDETLRQCLDPSVPRSLKSSIAPLQVKANAAGDEKIRHAGWLDQRIAGVALTKEQTAEIKHAIIKGRSHKAALELFHQKQKSQNPPNVPGASGLGTASSSGIRLPHAPRRSSSRNPPMREPPVPKAPRDPSLRTPPGDPQAPRGSAKRDRSGRRSDDPFSPTVQRIREEQAKAAPSYGRNPNVDFRLMDRPTGASPNIPTRAVSPIEAPPGDWVPGRIRAAAAALPYADGRSMIRTAAVAPKARPVVYAERPRARPVVYAERPKARPVVYAEQDRSLPPRREKVHRSPSRSRPVVHPESDRLVWLYFEQRWIPRIQVDPNPQGGRSTSPPPKQFRDPRDDPYRKCW